MRRSTILAIVIAVVASAWVLSGQFGERTGNGEGVAAGVDDQDQADSAPLTSVRTRRIVAQPMTDTLILHGRTAADRTVDIRAETFGVVDAVLVERGAAVTAGTPLIRLNVNEREARLAEAEALLDQRRIEHDAAAELNTRGFRSETDLAAARAALDAARAERHLAEIELSRTDIRAPFDGIVDDRMVEVGDYVDVGDTIARVVDLDPIRVIGQVAERHLGQVEPGIVGSVRLVDDRVVEGVVSFTGTIANETTRTYPVELEIENADGSLIQGITAELRLPISQIEAHFLSPAVLTLSDDGQVGVRAVNGEGHVVFHVVDVVGGNADGVWVGGLPVSLDLIVVGQDFVQTGQPVEAVPAEAEPADAGPIGADPMDAGPIDDGATIAGDGVGDRG